nr:hypothetical protein [Tanacetum cinerariifolium]
MICYTLVIHALHVLQFPHNLYSRFLRTATLLPLSFKTLCLLKYALMKRHDYDITVFFTKRVVTIMVSELKMVNTRTDADLSAAVQNALQTLLPQIHAEIREEFRTSSGPSDSGGNPHRSLFILGLNALISKSPVHLKRRQLPWTRRIGSLTWRRC